MSALDPVLCARVADVLAEAIMSCRDILARHGVHRIGLRDQLDPGSLRGTIDIVVGDAEIDPAVYTIVVDVGNATVGHVRGRWDVDRLRAIGLEALAKQADARQRWVC